MPYGHFKGLPRKLASGKVLRDKALEIGNNPRYDEYQCGLAPKFYTFFDKAGDTSTYTATEIFENQ